MNPYLVPEEGLQAVYRYTQFYDVPVTNQTAAQINRLCLSDPFFISSVVLSRYENKDLTTQAGVIDTVNFEVSDPESEMSMTWGEYIEATLKRVNDRNAKSLLLHLNKNTDREWTPRQLKETLQLDIDTAEIRKKLEILVKADVMAKGFSDIRYRGLQDGTLSLVLRSRFEEEINDFVPDLKKEFHEEVEKLKADKKSLQGRLNNLTGKFAEFQLFTEFRAKKRFSLTRYFDGVLDGTRLDIVNVVLRDKFQRDDGKEMEIDVRADSSCGRVVLVEVKKTERKTGVGLVRDFLEKLETATVVFSSKRILPAFLSTGGFTPKAFELCRENKIDTADGIRFF
ncbi:MAG: hypothetical protein GY866_41775 [Proteobacteria bacterium]|nr:hypothetical protein [Pseudomonadota bacterium]